MLGKLKTWLRGLFVPADRSVHITAERATYRRAEDPAVQAFYKLYAESMKEIPGDLRRFVERLAATTGLPPRSNEYPVATDSIERAAAAFVSAASEVFGFSLDLQVDDASQIDRFADAHLIDVALRPYFEGGKLSDLSETQAEQYFAARERSQVANEPLMYYAMGAFWGQWQARHRQAVWTLYPPLNPIQSFPDMITQGTTICSHPFSQVCKKLTDPEGDNLAFKAVVSTAQKRYLPPYPLLASLADAEHAVRQLLPEPAQHGLDAERSGNNEKAWELFCEAAAKEEQPQLLSMMIACAWRLEKYDMVDGISQRLLELVPDHPLTCHNLAVLYSNQPDLMNEAIELLERALRSDLRYARAHITLASCLAQAGRADEARPHAEWVRDNDQELRAEAEKFLAEL